MKLFLIAALMITSQGFTNPTNSFDVKIDLSWNGKRVSFPSIIVKDKETATVTQKTGDEEDFIEIYATEGKIQKHQGIMMKFTVGSIDKNGTRVVFSQPQILAKENEAAQITVSDKEKGLRELSLSVVARKNLRDL